MYGRGPAGGVGGPQPSFSGGMQWVGSQEEAELREAEALTIAMAQSLAQAVSARVPALVRNLAQKHPRLTLVDPSNITELQSNSKPNIGHINTRHSDVGSDDPNAWSLLRACRASPFLFASA